MAMTSDLMDKILYFCDYAAIAAGLVMIMFGTIGLAKAKPNGTDFDLQMALWLFSGLMLFLLSLLIYWILP